MLSKIVGPVAALMALVASTSVPPLAKAPTSWFVQAGATGDGTNVEHPTGSLESIERRSAAGDRIVVLPSDSVLDGGIALKAGQRLVGLVRAGRKPVITNSDSTRHLGCGVLVANGSTVSNLRIEGTVASGIYGRNASSVRIDSVDVHGTNHGQSFIEATFPTLPGRVPHGGMVFVHADASAEITVTSSTVTETSGMGIASIASGGAHTRLSIRDTRVEGGTRMGFYDVGIAALVKDRTATTRLEISGSHIKGRLSRSGRNVMIAASGGGRATARIDRIVSGATGQDGIVGAVMQSPSEITIHISNSVVEDAGQMNVEGSLINLPSEPGARAGEGRVSIEIARTTIRHAGAVPGFEDVAANIWMGGSQFIATGPPAMGRYRLRITDSRIDSAGRAGLEFGNKRITAAGLTEASAFDVVVRGSTIEKNGEADVKLVARGVRLDARQNCWGHPGGLAEDRVMVLAPAARSMLDATKPVSCAAESRSQSP